MNKDFYSQLNIFVKKINLGTPIYSFYMLDSVRNMHWWCACGVCGGSGSCSACRCGVSSRSRLEWIAQPYNMSIINYSAHWCSRALCAARAGWLYGERSERTRRNYEKLPLARLFAAAVLLFARRRAFSGFRKAISHRGLINHKMRPLGLVVAAAPPLMPPPSVTWKMVAKLRTQTLTPKRKTHQPPSTADTLSTQDKRVLPHFPYLLALVQID